MNFLVTGGAGFIGSHIVEALVKRGERVRVLDNLSTGRWENIAPFVDHIEFINGDVCDTAVVREAVQGVEFVFHQAALASVVDSIADPVRAETTNVVGTLNLFLAARDVGVRRVIYASSAAVYGDSPVSPKVETIVSQPVSPYGVSKFAVEHYGRVFAPLYGLETVGLRYFNVYGPRQDPNSPYAAVIPLFISAVLREEPSVIYGDGLQSRDFIYIADVVEANLLASVAPGVAGQVFNIACGRGISLLELLDTMQDIVGKQMMPHHVAPRPGDIRHSVADAQRAREMLEFTPAVSLEQGLRWTLEWYRETMQRQVD